MVAKGATLRKSSQNPSPDDSCSEEKPQRSVDYGMSLEERRHRDESCNDVYDAWPRARIVYQVSLQILRLQAVSRYRPIAFDPEGSSLDRGLPVNSPG
jgi:hypothetical protein